MINKNYIPYHVHTEYSLLDSCSKPSEFIDNCVKNGIKAISFSEHGKNLNWTEKWDLCKKSGIKYIHSVEIYLTRDLENKVRDNYHTVLLARNMDGVKELNKLISISCRKDHFYYTNRISFDEFLNISDNIISTSACLASPLNRLEEDDEYFERLINKYTFLEIQPHIHDEQKQYNQKIIKLSEQYNKQIIVGTDFHSSSKYKEECRAVLLKAKHKSYGDEDGFDLSFKNYDEIVEMFRLQGAIDEYKYIEALDNTNKLYDMTEDIELDLSFKYPISYGSREADSEKFKSVVYEKFNDKLCNGIIPQSQKEAFESAIEEELRVFEKLQMDGFMLSMSELISWCKDNGIAIGPARGSVGGSRVAYITDIIDLNPEEWGTVFSRFCNEDRVELGDIDVDCIEDDRPKIFQHIVEKFGREKTARVASFGTLQDKATIDEIGRALALDWTERFPEQDNPWSLQNISKIKSQYESDPESTRLKYKTLFYFFDGLLGTKISQSVHPAGMVISPITLDDNYGVFDKDDDVCLVLDMENVHDFTGIVKYDLLVLKTIQVIRDACKYAGVTYPKSHEIDWNDQAVWEDMQKDLSTVFQFESAFAADCFKKFKPVSIFDMSLVTASIRPSGASYREELLKRVPHSNPSGLIDELLKRNFGYLVYQEDIIAFLQKICGLSGSEADNVRRAIGRKQKDRLDKAMPSILEGYCNKSDKPKEVAEEEAKEFLKIIEDASSYMFGMNHSIAYCMVGYLCGYFRHYYPLEYLTSFLNNAANDDDIYNGTEYAKKIGINVTMPKWGFSKGEYEYDKEHNVIAKGLSSIKYMGTKVAEELYDVASKKNYKYFVEVLKDLEYETTLDSRQLDLLIKIDFFSEFGNQRELLSIVDVFDNMFKSGNAKRIKRDIADESPYAEIIQKYSVGVTKSGTLSASYTLLDIDSILVECEDVIKSSGLEDLSDITKVKNFANVMGYIGYISGKDEDRKKLYLMDIKPLNRKKDGVQFGYSFYTKSIGSGVESRFTVLNRVYNQCPVEKDSVIYCINWSKEGQYFKLNDYKII